MKKSSPKNVLMLLLTAMIWGSAFVAQSAAMDHIGPFTMNSIRSIIGGLFLIPCIAFLEKTAPKEKKTAPKGSRKELLLGGICCGAALCVASCLQQIGIQYTTVGKAGFLTTLYVVIVPFLSLLLFKKRIPKLIWVCVVLSIIGLYLLCMTGGMEGINLGDVYVLLCAVCFSVHILVIDYFAERVDPVRMSCIQFLVCGLMAAVPMLVLEDPQLNYILEAAVPILYAGILSCGVAYTLQAVAQRNCDPTVASLVLCLESVFSVIFGWIILGEAMGGRELLGCGMIFGAVILAQLPEKQ